MLTVLPTSAALPAAPATARTATDGAPEPGRFAQALGDAVAGKPDGPTAEGGPTPTPADAEVTEAPPAPTEAQAPLPDTLAELLAQLQPRDAPPAAASASSTASSALLDADSLPQAPRKTTPGNALPMGTRGAASSAAAEPQGSRFADRLAETASHTAGADDGPQAAAANATPPSPMAARSDVAALLSATPTSPQSTGMAGTSPATPAEARLPTGPANADFGAQISAQVTTFVRNGVEHARLHLNPADLGPVQVQIQVEGNTAAVHLSADNAQTRQALEQALPQLAGSLRDAGLTLTGGGVSQQPRQDAGRDASTHRGPGHRDPDDAGPESVDPVAAPARRRGVVDLVA